MADQQLFRPAPLPQAPHELAYPEPLSPAATRARSRFPRGLAQPPASFRFSADALLLGSFITPDPGSRILDLGTGCGVVALAMLCRQPECSASGVDIQPELIDAARENARRLGFASAFTALQADLADPALFQAPASGMRPLSSGGETGQNLIDGRINPSTFDLALANPPYRQGLHGRLPRSPSRRTALFEEPDTLSVFCRAACQALAPDGRFGIIYPASRFQALTAALREARFHPVRSLPLLPRQGNAPSLILVESRTAAADHEPGVREEPPLILHEGQGPDTRFTEAALRYCPFLACNTPVGQSDGVSSSGSRV